jgi:PAS domain S-box-containing protein
VQPHTESRLERITTAPPVSPMSKDVPISDTEDGVTLASAIVDTVRDPLLVLDQKLRIVAASRSFYQKFRLVPDNVRGRLIYEIDEGQWNIPELRTLLETITRDHATIEGYEVEREFPAIGHRIMCLNARMVFYEKGTHTTVLLAFEDITDRVVAERRVQDLLRDKDMLMEEMQHRVGNSLQIIASILSLKAKNVHSEEARLQLHDAHQRVLSVAAVQLHLHPSGRGDPVEIGEYLTKLCETLSKSMIGDRPISIVVQASTDTVLSRQAVNIGLIVAESVMNALKHAFPCIKQDAAIAVSYKVVDSKWTLTISDNGIGSPDPKTCPSTGGLGTRIVQSLAEQLGARVKMTSGSHGTAVSVSRSQTPQPEPDLT